MFNVYQDPIASHKLFLKKVLLLDKEDVFMLKHSMSFGCDLFIDIFIGFREHFNLLQKV